MNYSELFLCCFLKGPPKYTKAVLKKGDKTNFPKKGDTVSCWYTGTLEDGTVFDTNIPSGMTHLHCQLIVQLNYCPNKMLLRPSDPLTITVVSAVAKKKKQAKPLSFKVGQGKVIRGVSDADVLLYFSPCASTFFVTSLLRTSSSVMVHVHSGMRRF